MDVELALHHEAEGSRTKCKWQGDIVWCHVLLSAPIVGLGLFFVLPFPLALGIYLIVVLLSLLVYYKIMESTQLPVITGAEALLGKTVRTDANGSVHWQGEWWTVEPSLPLRRVKVNGLNGLRLQVTPLEDRDRSPDNLGSNVGGHTANA